MTSGVHSTNKLYVKKYVFLVILRQLKLVACDTWALLENSISCVTKDSSNFSIDAFLYIPTMLKVFLFPFNADFQAPFIIRFLDEGLKHLHVINVIQHDSDSQPMRRINIEKSRKISQPITTELI